MGDALTLQLPEEAADRIFPEWAKHYRWRP